MSWLLKKYYENAVFVQCAINFIWLSWSSIRTTLYTSIYIYALLVLALFYQFINIKEEDEGFATNIKEEPKEELKMDEVMYDSLVERERERELYYKRLVCYID